MSQIKISYLNEIIKQRLGVYDYIQTKLNY